MAAEAGEDPRAWVAVDETAAAFLSRSLATRPPIILPPPLHRAPLRPGNVVEIAGPSNSGKSHLLLVAAVQCILPKEWEGIYFGGLGKAVMFLDLDCRFDVLRLAQILRSRIVEGCSSAHPRNGELAKHGTKDNINCSFEDTLFSDCMQRFLYVRCYSSSEFIAALKTVESQLRGGVLGASVYFLMIDSIGAFYWMDRGSQHVRENKGRSLQSIIETVVQEIRKVLQLQPALVIVTKSPIYGEGTTAVNDFNRGSSLYMLEDSTAMRYSRQEEERNLSSREYMPPVWQSFITHRIKIQVEEAEVSSLNENDVPSVHTSEWVQPSLKTKEKFSINNNPRARLHPYFADLKYASDQVVKATMCHINWEVTEMPRVQYGEARAEEMRFSALHHEFKPSDPRSCHVISSQPFLDRSGYLIIIFQVCLGIWSAKRSSLGRSS